MTVLLEHQHPHSHSDMQCRKRCGVPGHWRAFLQKSVLVRVLIAPEGRFMCACRASLQRLGIQKTGLYMQHWPGFVTNGWCNDAFVEGLGDCARQGLTQAVGVSNFTADRVRRASSILEVRMLAVSHHVSLQGPAVLRGKGSCEINKDALM